MAEIWGALLGGAVAGAIGVGGSLIVANQGKKALDGQKGLLAGLDYKPIDIASVRKNAADAAAQNARSSLDLERSLNPDVADTRMNLSKSISDQLKLGGKVSPDVANMVARNARVAGGMNGGFGGTPGVTAATLGTTALGLLNQRQQNATDLLAANPLPVAGLDPGQVASLEVSNNNAENQFNLEKTGVQSNLLQSNANLNAGLVGSATTGLASLANLYFGRNRTPTTTTATLPTTNLPTFNTTIPSYNASLIPG